MSYHLKNSASIKDATNTVAYEMNKYPHLLFNN